MHSSHLRPRETQNEPSSSTLCEPPENFATPHSTVALDGCPFLFSCSLTLRRSCFSLLLLRKHSKVRLSTLRLNHILPSMVRLFNASYTPLPSTTECADSPCCTQVKTPFLAKVPRRKGYTFGQLEATFNCTGLHRKVELACNNADRKKTPVSPT